MYPAYTHWAHWSHLLSVLPMYPVCAWWVFGSLSPVPMTLWPLGRTTILKTFLFIKVSISLWQVACHSSNWPAGSPIMSLYVHSFGSFLSWTGTALETRNDRKLTPPSWESLETTASLLEGDSSISQVLSSESWDSALSSSSPPSLV